jgi:rRNA maturation endonuclease Nob1
MSKKWASISIYCRLCRQCHRLVRRGVLSCPVCGTFELVAVRCRVDRRDIEAYHKTFDHP